MGWKKLGKSKANGVEETAQNLGGRGVGFTDILNWKLISKKSYFFKKIFKGSISLQRPWHAGVSMDKSYLGSWSY